MTDDRAITATDIARALEHPERHPWPQPCPGLPSRAFMLAFYAHHPDQARRQLAALEVFTGDRPAPAEVERAPVDEQPATHGARRARLVAEEIAEATALSVEQALAVVERHGDVHPSQAVRLHHRMTEGTR